MKTPTILCGSALLLLSLTSCGGGDQPAGGTQNPPQQQAPSQPAAGKPAADTPTDKPADKSAAKTERAAPKKPAPRVRIDYAMVTRMFGAEPPTPPADTPSTPEKVALGKLLYHDQSLSKNGNISCASCHDLANYGVDNKPTSPGTDGTLGDRNSPTTYNAFRQFAQFWDGRSPTVEAQAVMPMLNSIEHAITDEPELVAKLNAKPELVEGFRKAFPDEADPVTPQNFGRAIGAFERTLVTRSRWDDYLDGNQSALTNEELGGLKTFMEVGCTTCHVNRALGGHMFQKIGVMKPYPTEDTGRMRVTNQEGDRYLFKVPGLLNVAKTAPYYHDGKIATLEEAVKNMASIQLGRDLTQEQVDSIVTFLNALTGELPAEFANSK